MSRLLGVAIGSTQSLPGEVEGNLAQIQTFARRAADEGMDLLLTPEMSASGYGGFPEVLAVAEVAGRGPIFDRLTKIAEETGVTVAAGFCELGAAPAATPVHHIAHYIVSPDGGYTVQRKFGVTPAEAPLAPHGDAFVLQVFQVREVRCGLLICADAGLPDRDQILSAAGVELLCVPTGAGGERIDRVTTAELMGDVGRATFLRMSEAVFWPGQAAADCLEQRRSLAAVNLVGYDGRRFHHVGHGSITNALGEVVGFFPGIVNLDRQRPCYAAATIDADEQLPSASI